MPHSRHKIALIAEAGMGKSTQILTLPGKVLVFAVDPNVEASLDPVPENIEIINLGPQLGDYDLRPKKLGGTPDNEPATYERMIDAITESSNDGRIEAADWLVLDGASFAGRHAREHHTYLNRKAGNNEGRSDYMGAGQTLLRVLQVLTSFPRNVMVMAHYRKGRDERSGTIHTEVDLPGEARAHFSKLFDIIWSPLIEIDADTGIVNYFLQTVPDPEHPGLRTTRAIQMNYLERTGRPLPAFIPVTLDWSEDLQKQGIGGLLPRRDEK